MDGSIEKRGENTYRLIVSGGKNLDGSSLPYLSSFPLDKIKLTDLMNLYDMLENDTQIKRIAKNNGQRTLKPLSPKTILEHHRLLSAMFQKAVYWQLLVNNPARRVKPPKTKKPKIEFFDDDECKLLINSLQDFTGSKLKYKVAILLDIFSGVRRGELVGLEWSDVDFKNETIEVNKSTQYLPEKGIFDKDPKTESSNRIIPIPSYITNVLLEYKEWYYEQKELFADK